METLFKDWTGYLASGIEAAAVLIITLAVVEAAIRGLWVFAHPDMPPQSREVVRLRLGRWLALGLELELAADIVRTAIAPTWNEIAQLAAIVVIRTVLNYFLQRDIDNVVAQERDGTTLQAG
jgi:uncharacterized membrane protein